ncbi:MULTISPECIES: ParB/RepB/Spo0J family partition protein [Novosphingobium]|uniref:ParB/RepB/Spo0J family partition protein n=1 Tax=Novosphingobium mangrovi (ex Huang et al. 2023) TaxID=2976432 RepID=A0ABT2I5I9_9SPHN|nr:MULTISPECIES: ParB/RepB/Spo0J family partition protein [Novosphingobium]MCT2400074.1 ParB/RepB/Spo0J family partition protein [Novosphingobium mangrovi (ex Huang et al. 2023)]CCA93071.1 chromosome partitioning protein, ParB family [Novosphingobium sp. PP1Y]
MSQPIILVSAAKLAKSPSNVRKTSDPEADAQLEASIVAHGVLQNLIGLPVARKKGQYRITAGGRRLDAVHRAIEKGDLPTDYELPVKVLADANDAVEISLSENFFKLAMNPADACRAFQDIIETEKKTPADIAKRFGLTERFVLGRLRLAGLAEPVFEALREGAITLDIAMAYASTSDTARQASVFEQLGQGYYRANVGEIRRQLASGGYHGSDPKAMLVGRDDYVAAGGRIDADLFSDDATEMWIDGDILDHLAEEKLTAAAEAIRQREGFAEIRAVPASHIPYMETYSLRQVQGELPPLTADEEARCEQIQSELEAIEEAAADENGEGYTEDDEARTQELEAEYEAIQSRTPVLTEEQKASALAYVVIGRDGQPRIHEQLYVAPVETPADGDDDTSDDEDADHGDEAESSAKPVVSQRLADELAMMKTELLAVHVASDPRFAFDVGTFIMADAATRHFGSSDLASELRARAPSPRVSGFESGTLAAEEWAKLDSALDRSWIDHEDVRDRYDAFCSLPDEARAGWLGWAVARTFDAVPAGRTGSVFIDHLGSKLAIDVAAWWRPTAKNYFDRITKPAILGLFETVGTAELRQRYAASKKHDLAASAEKLFAGDILVEAEIKERALTWLPDAMRFELIDGEADGVIDADEVASDEPTDATGLAEDSEFGDLAEHGADAGADDGMDSLAAAA